MNRTDQALYLSLEERLAAFEKKVPLLGIQAPERRRSFLMQVVESVRRINYVKLLLSREISPSRIDPTTSLFDPIKGAILCLRNEDLDEAFWLVFLSVHFGQHRRTKWRLTADVYGRLGRKPFWTWKQVSSDTGKFRKWISANQRTLSGGDGVPRHFGNHRKYQSLNGESTTGTGAAVETYVNWVCRYESHLALIGDINASSRNDPRRGFDAIYRSMKSVASFGRTARFDYLTMLQKLGLSPFEPGSAYLAGATGPLAGARLLLTGDATIGVSRGVLDRQLCGLATALEINMQAVEDSLCNWQKSPALFKRFRG